MHTKLTLRLDDSLIDAAKAYAAEQGRSVSTLVADYFAALTFTQRQPQTLDAGQSVGTWKATLGPITRALVGAAVVPNPKNGQATDSATEQSEEEAYYAHLAAKHQ